MYIIRYILSDNIYILCATTTSREWHIVFMIKGVTPKVIPVFPQVLLKGNDMLPCDY